MIGKKGATRVKIIQQTENLQIFSRVKRKIKPEYSQNIKLSMVLTGCRKVFDVEITWKKLLQMNSQNMHIYIYIPLSTIQVIWTRNAEVQVVAF